jgi:hypothetical protein
LTYLAASRAEDEELRARFDVERIRYLEIERIARPFFEEELRLRRQWPKIEHYGVQEEFNLETQLIESLLGLQNRWHPECAQWLHSSGAVDGYAEYFRFPCCNRIVKDHASTGVGDPPSQFRVDGCREIPRDIQYDRVKRSNPFLPVILKKGRESKNDDKP